MCGIAGELRFDGELASLAVVEAMTRELAPRGPDSGGSWSQGAVAFGHRRLKVMDTSDLSQQPMVDQATGAALVFNGAIYNHPELRRELQSLGHRFFSTGDTEVVMRAYREWGERCVERFEGMFAFAIHDRDSGRTFVARDRLGIKPLYYAEVTGGLRFASTLPALLRGGGVDDSIDPVALHHYMTFHSVVPAPRTILRGVRKVPPATTWTIEADGTRRERIYWDVEFGPDAESRDLSRDAWVERVREELDAAVRRRLVADVPVGVLLSGGLDSSLVVGLLARHGAKGLRTFSIGFDTVGDEEGDEFRYSDVVVERFGTEHTKIRVDPARTLGALEPTIRAMSEPMVSHDCVGFFLLSEEVRKHVKVVQSGQGADEVFAGYHWYPPMLGSKDPIGDYARVFFDRDHAEMRRVLRPDLVLEDDPSRAFVEAHFARRGAPRGIERALRLDTRVMLVDDPVKRVDNMTMAHGLEARVPFLDHHLVELAARVPAELQLEDGGKGVLKRVARGVIPDAVIDRPKGYFPVPALKYLRGAFLDMVRETLATPAARERSLFREEYLAELLADPEHHLTPLRGSKLWQCALLERWLQAHDIRGGS